MKILKFGGSSLATPATIRAVGEIVMNARRRGPAIVVVSAFHGVTNQLLECAGLAERGDTAYERILEDIARRHRSALQTLAGGPRPRALKELGARLEELRSTLQGVYLLRHCPLRALDMTASFGERLSALVVAAYLDRLHQASFVDARQFVRTDDQFTHANVQFAKTNRATRLHFRTLFRRNPGTVPVVTGFIGATDDGQTTTIGRNG